MQKYFEACMILMKENNFPPDTNAYVWNKKKGVHAKIQRWCQFILDSSSPDSFRLLLGEKVILQSDFIKKENAQD